MSKAFNAEVVDNHHLTGEYSLLSVRPLSPFIPPHAGHFFMIESSYSSDPLLKRPFSVLDSRDGCLYFLIALRGKGTSFLRGLKTGRILNMLGPLGRGFPLVEESEPLYIVAGGVGIACVFPLIKKYRNATVFYGSRRSDGLILREWIEEITSELYLSTEDGSEGEKGDVLSLLEKYIADHQEGDGRVKIYCCGPHPMYEKMAEVLSEKKEDIYVSLEERMACGIGACLSCVVMTAHGYLRICREGTVFRLSDIRW